MNQTSLAGGRFVLQGLLGEGGMGRVYAAFDREQNAKVALKLLSHLTPDDLLRFKNEFRALQGIGHPNLVRLGELMEEGGQWFFTMELLEGRDFVAFVRRSNAPAAQTPSTVRLRRGPVNAGPPPAMADGFFDEARLRDALAQLVRGLSALHATGRVHRDVKPSNIVVTSEGRVVLLDFGLVANIDRTDAIMEAGLCLGTPAYMAPEQARSAAVGIATDWYAVGAVLHQALTGSPPFVGRAEHILQTKQYSRPVRPSELCSTVPADLDDLCAALLRTDPDERPIGAEVLRRLGAAAGPPPATTNLTAGLPFVGRARELALLASALSERRHGRAALICLHGPSGVGKSALLERFAEQAASQYGALVLGGRCYEREYVPFKAADGVVDALSLHLRALPTPQADALVPPHATLLSRLFPVLASVPAIARAGTQGEVIDPSSSILRFRAFRALRQLLHRLAQTRPLLLTVEDLQWTDADSLELFRAILRPPDPPPLLLVATMHRSLAQDLDIPIEVSELPLQPLPVEAARELAEVLLERAAPALRSRASEIAAEAAGHPLFIQHLVRHLAGGERRPGRLPSLDDVLSQSVAAIDPHARAVLNLLAISGAPVRSETVARAANLDFVAFSEHAMTLRLSQLVRARGAGKSDVIEPYHDRVRMAVLTGLGGAERKGCHRRLAEAIEGQDEPDEEALAVHWQSADEPVKAAAHAVSAARRATQALAFERAAQLYRMALEAGSPDPELRLRLAEVLSEARRNGEAALVYLEAADGASGAEATRYRRNAAEQLVLAGRIDEGLRALSPLLEAAGLRLPAERWRSLLSLVFGRVRVRLRSLRLAPRPSAPSPALLERVDLCWTLALGLGMTEPVRAAQFQVHNFLLATRAGDPVRLLQALSAERVFGALQRSRPTRHMARLMAACEQLEREVSDPLALSASEGARGVIAAFDGRFRQGLEHFARAEPLLRQLGSGRPKELDLMRSIQIMALFYAGQIDALREQAGEMMADAERRGDRIRMTFVRTGLPNLVWLFDDAPRIAREMVEAAMREWARPGLDLLHYFGKYALAQIDLYEGNARGALEVVARAWAPLRQVGLFRLQAMRIQLRDLRARCALAAVAEIPNADLALVRSAERDAHALEREGVSWATALARPIRAGIAAVRGDDEAAAQGFEAAAKGFDGLEMALHAAVARRRLGALLAGDRGRALVQSADGWMSARGIVRPERIVALLLGGSA